MGAIAAFEDATERGAKDLATELLALEFNHLKITRKANRHFVSEKLNHLGVARFQSHQQGGTKHATFRRSVTISGHQREKCCESFPGSCPFARSLDLGQQKVGIQTQVGIAIGGLDQGFASFKKGLAVTR